MLLSPSFFIFRGVRGKNAFPFSSLQTGVESIRPPSWLLPSLFFPAKSGIRLFPLLIFSSEEGFFILRTWGPELPGVLRIHRILVKQVTFDEYVLHKQCFCEKCIPSNLLFPSE